jgi:serine/threonine protein kinase
MEPTGQGELADYAINPKPIGKGAYGLVHQGTNKRTGEKVALKKTQIDNYSDGIPSTTMREISILTELQHPNIVSLKDVVMTDTCIFFIQEFCNIDLRAFLLQLQETENLSPAQIKSYMFQILTGIKVCH